MCSKCKKLTLQREVLHEVWTIFSRDIEKCVSGNFAVESILKTNKSQLDSVVGESKLLGIKLDNCLTWENQMAHGKEQMGSDLAC